MLIKFINFSCRLEVGAEIVNGVFPSLPPKALPDSYLTEVCAEDWKTAFNRQQGSEHHLVEWNRRDPDSPLIWTTPFPNRKVWVGYGTNSAYLVHIDFGPRGSLVTAMKLMAEVIHHGLEFRIEFKET